MNIEKLKSRMKHEEGCIDHMYLDTRGLVTIGVGCLLANENKATKLPFTYRDSGLEADVTAISDEYHYVKIQQSGLRASSYLKYTQLILPQTVIDQLLEQHIFDFARGLENEFSEFGQFPESAQLALLDMAFNLGLTGLIRKFPSLVKAVYRRDWTVCARECHRRGIGETRNKETERLFLVASEQNH